MNSPFFRKRERLIVLEGLKNKKSNSIDKNIVSDNGFIKCPQCKETLTQESVVKNLYVCNKCSYHFKISAYDRLKLIFDDGSIKEINKKLVGKNPIGFPKYEEKLKEQRIKSNLNEAVVTAIGKIDGIKVVTAVMDSSFLMGSMGTAVGEKITVAIEYATKNKLPIIIFSASGGARMQEGIFSLMQMAKTSAAIEKHNMAGLLYISVFTNPTTGGVTASFASLGDIMLSEPKALIGFAGPRVIKETIKQELPEDFQTAEYLLKQGFLDGVVKREDMKGVLSRVLMLHGGKRINA